ncbi:MAG: Immunoglobulin I-set domain protein, partial [Pedosphaera sp.]|nr:Immunoglobulin I-set domain protein [Pedosphaera sp.]
MIRRNIVGSNLVNLHAWRGRHWLMALLLLVGLTSALPAMADCLPAPTGLVGWWPGDGSATNIAGTNNGTLQGGATASAVGFVGQTFTFDGTNSFVQIADAPVLRPTNFTVETWIKFASLDSAGLGGSAAGDQYIVFKQNTRSGDFEGLDLSKTREAGGDTFRFLVTSATAQLAEIHSTTKIATGVWYHVAAVRGSNFTQLYVNGHLERQTNVAFAQNYGTLPLYFGTSGQSFWDHKLNGALDEVSLFNRALSSNEIAAIYAAGAAGKCKTAGGPAITAQPQTQSVVIGSNALFTVTATGTAPLSYQWQFNGAVIPGATATNLPLSNVQPTDAGNYTVVVTNSTASTTSAVAVLTVLLPPVITAGPQSTTSLVGASAAFTATATGSAPLSYQWQLNGVSLVNGGRISGTRTNALTISNLLPTDAGNYTLVVTNPAGAVTSAIATLTVNGPPVVTVQPASQNVTVGANVSFGVTASGTQPLSYQWQRNGVDLADGGNVSGAGSSALSLANVQLTDSANFQVVITNFVGSVTSVVAVLNVNPPPVAPGLVTSPTNQTVTAGSNVSFTVSATGTAPLSYQWRKNGANLGNGGNVSGATTPALVLTSVQAGDAANYQVVVTNVAGAVTSVVASLTVNLPPTITTQPASQTVAAGTNVTFGVAVSGTAPFTYQWRRNGTNLTDGGQLSGAAGAVLSLGNIQSSNAGNYSVVVSNVAGSATSAVATLTVNTPGSCSPPPAGLVGWWPGEGNANDIAGADNGALQGGATAVVTGQVGLGFSFDGTNSFVQIPDAPALHPANLTIEAWVRFTSLDSAGLGGSAAGDQYIVFKQNTRSGDFEGFDLSKTRSGGKDIFRFLVTSATAQSAEIHSTTALTTGVWYHV